MKFFFWNQNIQFFSNFIAGNTGKKRGLSVIERENIFALSEEEYSEKRISKKLKFSKTAIYQEIVRFSNFKRFRICTGLEDPGLPPKRVNT